MPQNKKSGETPLDLMIIFVFYIYIRQIPIRYLKN